MVVTPDVLEVATVDEVTLGDPEVTVMYDCVETVVVVVASGAAEVTVLTSQPLSSQWVTVVVVYDFGEALVSVVVTEVSLGASEVTVLTSQPLSSQWVTVAVVYD